MKQKKLSFALALALAFGLLAGCTANQPSVSAAPSTEPSAAASETPSEAPSTEPSQEPSPTPAIPEPSQPPVDELGAEWAKPGTIGREYLTYTYSGQTVYRWFSYYIPTTYQAGDKLSLVMTLHGSTSNAAMQLGDGGWVKYAEQEGFIVLAPESVAIHADGTLSSQGKTMGEIGQTNMSYLRWNATNSDPQGAYGVDDVEYLCRLVDLFVDTGYADASSVYACGLSHGAFMSLRLAVEAPEKFAGVGIVSGLLCNQYLDCNPLPATKVVFFHGTLDSVVPITGYTNWTLSLDGTAEWFLEKYGMENNPTVTEMPDTAEDFMTTTRYGYADANGVEMVVKYVITSGGHTWPGGKFTGGTKDFSATEVIWQELKDIKKPVE